MKAQKKIILSLTVTLLLLVSIFLLFSCKNDLNIPSGNSSKSTLLKTDPIVGKWGTPKCIKDPKTSEMKDFVYIEIKEENGKLIVVTYLNDSSSKEVKDYIVVYDKEKKIYKTYNTKENKFLGEITFVDKNTIHSYFLNQNYTRLS